MLETRTVTARSTLANIPGGGMRFAILMIELNADAVIDLTIPGAHVDSFSNLIMVTYVDSSLYRRVVNLSLGLALGDYEFNVVKRLAALPHREGLAVASTDDHIDVISRQIKWATRNREEATRELGLLRGLIGEIK